MIKFDIHLKHKIGKFLIKLVPSVWVFLFICLPLLFVMRISFSETDVAFPPYQSILDLTTPYAIKINVYLKNYWEVFQSDFYSHVVISSLKISMVSTFFALLVGYSMAYGINSVSSRLRPILLLLVIIPFFTSFLMRIYAWMALLSMHGLINRFMMFLGITHEPVEFLGHMGAVCVGIINCYLPFMVLPIYAALEKIDYSYLEAAYDLGARPWQAFRKITLPLSLPGVITGCTLVFIPVMGEFVIPELLGSSRTITLGRAIFLEFFTNHNWPMTCTMAIITLIVVVFPIMIFQHYQMFRKK